MAKLSFQPAWHFALGFGLVTLAACGVDDLEALPEGEPPPASCPATEEMVGSRCLPRCPPNAVRVGVDCWLPCDPGLVRYDGDCVSPGAVAGRVCNDTTGDWVRGAQVDLALADGGYRLTRTTVDGGFSIDDVPPGDHELWITDGPAYQEGHVVHVEPGVTTRLGPSACGLAPGYFRGRVCDPASGGFAQDALATITAGPSRVGATANTDGYGVFVFDDLVPGLYEVSTEIDGVETAVYSGTVTTAMITDVGPEVCAGTPGTVSGRICGAPGVWLVGATVGTSSAGVWVETTTDGTGRFSLSGLSPGPKTLEVDKGSLHTTIAVTVRSDGPTALPDPVCLPLAANVAVITGLYDRVQDLLTGLGYRVRAEYDATGETLVDAEGGLDLIDGRGDLTLDPPYWITGFALDPAWLSRYDIIFIGCGASDNRLNALPNPHPDAVVALHNLADFVAGGGSLYVSDWAYEIVRLAFPGRVNFHGDDTRAGRAKTGDANFDLPARVIQPTLAAAIGTANITLNLEMGAWVVLEPDAAQPPDLHVYVSSNAIEISFGEPYPPAPMLITFPHGDGRVLYTSFHNDSQNTRDLEEVLRFGVFEL